MCLLQKCYGTVLISHQNILSEKSIFTKDKHNYYNLMI
jgi:hypothetical protein